MIIIKVTQGSRPKPYTTKLDTVTRETTCDCRGWTTKKVGKERTCKHCDDIHAENPTNGTPVPVAAMPAMSTAKAPRPMLASAMTLAPGKTVFERMLKYCNRAWLAEIKFDGERAIVSKVGDVVICWSRARGSDEPLRKNLTTDMLKALRTLPDGLFDGELCIPNGKSWNVKSLEHKRNLVFVMFDVLELFGQSARDRPYIERRNLLAKVLRHYTQAENEGRIIIPDTYPVSVELVRTILDNGGEGAIFKRVTSTYQCRRSEDWIKAKNEELGVLVIYGFGAGENGPYSKLLLRDVDGFETSCKTLNAATIRDIAKNPGKYLNQRFVLKYQERTPDGLYRHPRWDHLAGEGE